MDIIGDGADCSAYILREFYVITVRICVAVRKNLPSKMYDHFIFIYWSDIEVDEQLLSSRIYIYTSNPKLTEKNANSLGNLTILYCSFRHEHFILAISVLLKVLSAKLLQIKRINGSTNSIHDDL